MARVPLITPLESPNVAPAVPEEHVWPLGLHQGEMLYCGFMLLLLFRLVLFILLVRVLVVVVVGGIISIHAQVL